MQSQEQQGVDSVLLDLETTWASFSLDPRLLKAISNLGWSNPTLVQSKSIPLALQGKDILAKARTGSGKTAAYAVPIVQRILSTKDKASAGKTGVKALILLPTRDLCEQVNEVFDKLTHYCHHLVRHIQIAGDVPFDTQKHRLAEHPDVLIATPGKLVQHLEKKSLTLTSSLQMVVIDEADLILSYGYQDDITTISKFLPKICQGFLMSATLSPEVEGLKKTILHTPVILRLEEEQRSADSLQQFVVDIPEDDKFLLLYVLLKLKLLKGKVIVFVNSIDRCFKVKLFLERFSLKSAVLNSELPQNSRYHAVQQFNKGVFDLLIASDENAKGEAADDSDEESEDSGEENEEDGEEGNDDEEEEEKKAKKSPKKDLKASKKSRRADDEYGVARGMDFQNVSAVVNFDFPRTSRSYTHRIGRTARAGKAGVSLSFVTNDNLDVLKKVHTTQSREGSTIKPYQFKTSVIEGFRYRVEDVLRSVTKASIKEARFQELKQEMLNSDKLKSFFEENPKDLETLKHTKALLGTQRFGHLKMVPSYLMPTKQQKEEALPSLAKNLDEEYAEHFGFQSRKRSKRKRDPLESFSYSGRKPARGGGKKGGPNKQRKTSEIMADK